MWYSNTGIVSINPGFRNDTCRNFYYTIHTSPFIELEQKIDLNRQPWFTSFLVQQTQTQITQPEFPKKKRRRSIEKKLQRHYTTPLCIFQPPNHPIHLYTMYIILYSCIHKTTMWATIYITKFILCLRFWIVMLTYIMYQSDVHKRVANVFVYKFRVSNATLLGYANFFFRKYIINVQNGIRELVYWVGWLDGWEMLISGK